MAVTEQVGAPDRDRCKVEDKARGEAPDRAVVVRIMLRAPALPEALDAVPHTAARMDRAPILVAPN